MRRTRWLLVLLALATLAALTLTSCGQEPDAVEPAKEEVEEQTEQKQESVDEVLNSVQDAVGELAAAVGGLEARVEGLQINSDLQEIQRKLDNAIEEVGDKKVAALEELSDLVNNLIYRVETAAQKLPEGGAVRTELEDFAQKLKGIQSDLAEAAASYEASSTPSP